jgi:hypothetical protein
MSRLTTIALYPLPDRLQQALRFRRWHERFPNLRNPSTFSEKVVWKKLHDRRPLLTLVSDKYRVRDYVAQRVGPQILADLLYVTNDPATIPFDRLPERYVVKANHGSGWTRIVLNGKDVDRAALIRECEGWLRRNLYNLDREWAYKDISPCILVEEFLDGGGIAPIDFKFFVFGGRPLLIQVDVDRHSDHRRNLYDPNWRFVEVGYSYPHASREIHPPMQLQIMLQIAADLGSEFDFVRVDLYEVSGRVRFGEMTNYPEGGMARFDPESFDTYLGGLWQLPPSTDLVRRSRGARGKSFH